ncbi:MAG: sugar ABC transporter substrate-binding protein, partial [Caldilineaceae bacterium]|nr:sugar ABC transporter substrate-binding protein [Caldilineaceae bacterium]
MRTRVLTILALLGVLAIAVTGCAAAPPAATAPGETVVTWAMWGSPAELATHQSVADAYMAENPDVAIEILSEPWGDYFTKMQALWAGGDGSVIPDILFLWPTPSYAAEGVLENLQPFIDRDGYNVDDYWPDLLESAKYDGDVYGFPRDIGLEVLYYNKDVFDEVGVPYPDETWTWADLETAANQLKVVDDTGRVSRYGLGMEGGKYMLWVLQNHGALLDDYRNPSACTLDQPEAVQGLEFFANLMATDAAMTSDNLNQAGGDAAVFQAGQVAMIIQNASRVSAFNAAEMNYDVSVVPIPDGGRRAASAGGAAWTMSAGSDNKEDAWHFLQRLQSTNGGQRI